VSKPSDGHRGPTSIRDARIPTNDMWIAAIVLQHGFVLFARDEHFTHLPIDGSAL
jgi:predicted nucleic acid-binding protein